MKSAFPKQLFVAKEGIKKNVYYGADERVEQLYGFVSEKDSALEVGVYELVEVKRFKLNEEK